MITESERTLRFSFIIIAREESEIQRARLALSKLIAQKDEFEVIVALGTNPSAQRNAAVQSASGEWLIFLDNDSAADPRLLHYLKDAISYDERIGVVGGPSVYEDQHTLFMTAVQSVYSSVFGLGPFRSRYTPLGRVRPSDESELILCNLAIRRELFLSVGGLKTDLHPNEENEFLNRVQRQTQIHYHPLMICYREPRRTYAEFILQMIRYGEGRAKHLVISPGYWNKIFLLPLFFFIYVSALPYVALLPQFQAWQLVPLALYLLFSFSATVFAVLTFKNLWIFGWTTVLFPSCHYFYGLGLAIGFLRYPLQKKQRPVEDISVFKLAQQ